MDEGSDTEDVGPESIDQSNTPSMKEVLPPTPPKMPGLVVIKAVYSLPAIMLRVADPELSTPITV